MYTIHKYPLSIANYQTVTMPHGAEILCVQMQRDTPCLWAVVDPSQPWDTRVIRIFGTGCDLPDCDEVTYIGTIQQFDGRLVWHVFQDAKDSPVYVLNSGGGS